MITKQLTRRQAYQAEILSQFFFIIIYCFGKQNSKADTLTWKEQDVGPQDKLKAQHRTHALLYFKQLNLYILKELDFKWSELAPIKGDFLDKPMGLIDCILTANRTVESLKALYD